jgi:crossover junction endodeoxyribonuclease RuvC
MSSAVTLGIDCGYRTGGVALVGENWAEVHDLPVYSEGGVDVVALLDILTSADVDHIYIERQQAMPKQGVSSTFKLGYGFGQIVTTAALSRAPYTLVTPNNWKRSLNLPKDKDASRRLAQQWFPMLASDLKRKKDEHRAEALLIAYYGRVKSLRAREG